MAAPPTRPALRERYDRRQHEVVQVAARVFAERGYHATTMDDLSEATGLASGGLYHYIGSKEQLLFRIFEQLMDPLLEEARAIERADDPPQEQLRRLLRAWMAHIERHRDHMIVFAREWHLVERDARWERVREHRDQFERILARLLRRIEPQGSTTPRDRRLALLALLGMVNYTPQWFRPGGRLTAEQIADGYCDMLLASLGLRQPSS